MKEKNLDLKKKNDLRVSIIISNYRIEENEKLIKEYQRAIAYMKKQNRDLKKLVIAKKLDLNSK